MNVIRKLVKSDREGALHLDLSLIPDRPYEVVLVYQLSEIDTTPAIIETPEERTKALIALAGSWQGEFVRDRGEHPGQGANSRPSMTPAEWAEFVEATAGSIDDETFRRHEQCPAEERLAL